MTPRGSGKRRTDTLRTGRSRSGNPARVFPAVANADSKRPAARRPAHAPIFDITQVCGKDTNTFGRPARGRVHVRRSEAGIRPGSRSHVRVSHADDEERMARVPARRLQVLQNTTGHEHVAGSGFELPPVSAMSNTVPRAWHVDGQDADAPSSRKAGVDVPHHPENSSIASSGQPIHSMSRRVSITGAGSKRALERNASINGWECEGSSR